MLSGDKNSLDEKQILALNPNFRQLVRQNTRKDKILTIVISDLHSFYHNPTVIPPVTVDVPGQGVPSDHSGVLTLPITAGNSQRTAESRKVKIRPLPESLITKFGDVIVSHDWSSLTQGMSSTTMVNIFESETILMVENTFPEKVVHISNYDKPFMTQELKQLRRKRQRIYRKEGRSSKYLQLKTKFDQKLKMEAEKYKQKILTEVSEGKRNNSYKALRKLEAGESFGKTTNFTLPSHAEDNLSPLQSAERLADYFSQISQEFEPICTEGFPPWIKEKLLAGKSDHTKPVLEEYEVYEKLVKSKKPNSLVPGDLPVQLVKSFTPELAVPITKINNRITETGEYPRQWVT